MCWGLVVLGALDIVSLTARLKEACTEGAGDDEGDRDSGEREGDSSSPERSFTMGTLGSGSTAAKPANVSSIRRIRPALSSTS